MDFEKFADYVESSSDTEYQFVELANGLFKAIAEDDSHAIMIDPKVPFMWAWAEQYYLTHDDRWQLIVGWGASIGCAMDDWCRECDKLDVAH
jgi:hypothetical protein